MRSTDPHGNKLLVIERSISWRRTPTLLMSSPPAAQLIATRWKDQHRGDTELFAAGLLEHYTVVVPLAVGRVACHVDGKLVHEGPSNNGSVCITAPTREVRCWFQRPIEAVHVFIPAQMISAAFEDMHGTAAPAGLELSDERTRHDPVLCQIASLLVTMAEDEDEQLQLQADVLGAVALTRILSRHTKVGQKAKSFAASIPSWRLRLALDYLEANLSEKLTLNLLAAQAGLSPMYFAAQFRRTVGVSPSRYLHRRRLERAKEMLRSKHIPLSEIALSVGFSSQTHFTTAFRSSVGETPGRWRQVACD